MNDGDGDSSLSFTIFALGDYLMQGQQWVASTWVSWVPPSFLMVEPTAHTLTDLIDNILTSTSRLLAISNFLLALTYSLHTAVADWFFGSTSTSTQQRDGIDEMFNINNNYNNNHHHATPQ